MSKKILDFDQYFESVQNIEKNKDLKVVNYELPEEVKKTTTKILKDIFDSVKKMKFYSNGVGDHVVEFETNEQDFKYIEETEKLKMDSSYNVSKKLEYDVELIFDEKSEEDYTVSYLINFYDKISNDEDNELEEDEDQELLDDDEYYKSDLDDDYDIDDLDKNLNPDKLKKQKNDFKGFDDIYIDDEDDDDL